MLHGKLIEYILENLYSKGEKFRVKNISQNDIHEIHESKTRYVLDPLDAMRSFAYLKMIGSCQPPHF